MEKLPKSVRDSLARQQGGDPHTDADLLTAFAEGSATQRERQTVLAHLAACSDCREVLALALAEVATPGPSAVAPETGYTGRVRRWIWIPALGAVAVVAISASLLLVREQKSQATQTAGVARQQKSEPAKPSQVAQAPAVATADVPKRADAAKSVDAAPKPLERTWRDEQREVASAETKVAQTKVAQTKAKDQLTRQMAKSAEADKADSTGAFQGAVGASSQTVEVSAAAPLVDVNPANAPAAIPPQPARRAAANDSRRGGAVGGVMGGVVNNAPSGGPYAQNQSVQNQNAQNQNAANNSAKTAANKKSVNGAPSEMARIDSAPPSPVPPPPSQNSADGTTYSMARSLPSASAVRASWRIDSDGHLLRSFGASAFTRVLSETNTVFRAVSVNGADIWAAGNAGALYHSTDNGAHWTPVLIRDKGKQVTANITSLRFQDALRGVVKSESGQSWTTVDGGVSWTK